MYASLRRESFKAVYAYKCMSIDNVCFVLNLMIIVHLPLKNVGCGTQRSKESESKLYEKNASVA